MGNLSHILAGFSLGFQHRSALRKLLDSTSPTMNILGIDLEQLQISGVTVMALDFDGVLAPHGDPTPLPQAVEWMKSCQELFGGDHIFILSNKPTNERRAWFAENFPAIRFISGVRKKPYPDGLNKAGELAKVPLSQILMVDDRLLTGCLAAIVAGARPCYIRSPYTSLTNRPAAELFFRMLRVLERAFVGLVTSA